MATQAPRDLENSYSRLFILIHSVASRCLLFLLKNKGKMTTEGNITDFLSNHQKELNKLTKKSIHEADSAINFIENDKPIDVSLLCKLLFCFFDSEKHNLNIPTMCREEKEQVNNIKATRDRLAHTRRFDDNDFLQMWTSVWNSLGELCHYLEKHQSEDINKARESVLLRQTQCNISIESLRHFEEYHGDIDNILSECMRLEFPLSKEGATSIKMKHSDALQKLKKQLESDIDFTEHQRILPKTQTFPIEVRIQCEDKENSSDIADILLSVFKLACCSEESLPSSLPLSEALSSAVMRLVKQIQSRHAVDSVKGKKGSVLLDIGAMSKRGILDIIHFLESDSAEETLQEIANALCQETDRKVKISAELNEEAVTELTQKLGYSSADEDVTVDVSVVTVCAVHRQNAYTHFCEDHDTSVCRDCINENHKECKRIAPITDKAATTKEDIFQCKQEVGRLKESLIEESKKTNKLFSDLQTEEMDKNRYVEQMKADFDKKLMEEKRKIEDERISRCIKSNRCLIDQQKQIENVKKQVKALEDVTSKDAVTQFLQIEVTKKAIKPINEEIPKIKKAVSDLSKEIKPVVAYKETDSIVDIPLRLSAYHYSDLSLTHEHDKDLGERWITGCLVENGILILCDRLQGSVLLFSTLKDKSECFELQLDSPPYGICIAKTPDDRTFFITMPTLEKYAKVTVDSSHRSLSINRPYLSTGGECYGIASDKENNRVFITCYNKTKGGCIEVRNINNGELLRKIGINILYWPKQVRITKNKGKFRLFVADSQDNNVVCFSEDGWPEFKIRADGNPSDFFVKDDGDVVVCASTMHELSIISQNRTPRVILRQEDGLFHPTSIALSGKWLVVGMMNKLKLYTTD